MKDNGMKNASFTRLHACCALLAVSFSAPPRMPAQTTTEASAKAIRDLIATYATAVDRADAKLARQLFSNGPEVTFIHPRGEEHGRAQIEANVFENLMGSTFSERKLTPNDIAVHVYGDTAWSEFNWDFVARVRKDGSAFHSRGRETQIYHRQDGQWKILHVHYSGVPVTGNLQSF
jgi:uncharacterized protein (TIGR02246 family)